MCDRCAPARLAAELQLAELEVAVIDLEARAGLNWPGAARPLHDHEIRAQVRFADLDRLGAEAAALIARHADDVRQATRAALRDDLRAVLAAGGDAFALLARLQLLSSIATGDALPLEPVLAAVAARILDTLARARTSAAVELLDEARRQGVAAAVLPDDRHLAITQPERAALQVLARQVAEAPMRRALDVAWLEARAGTTRGTDPGAVVDAVASAVDATSPAGVEDAARQAVTMAVNQGRVAAARETPEPEEVYASELLDGNTCRACADVDGRMYDSLASALVDYPSGGTYARCAGGPRCRGTLVFVWPTEQAPTLDQSPVVGDRGHPIDRTPQGPTVEQEPEAIDLPQAVGGPVVGPNVVPTPGAGQISPVRAVPAPRRAPRGDDAAEDLAALAPSLNDRQRAHVLVGDAHGGGHRYGVWPSLVDERKSWFPQDWDDARIVAAITRVVEAPIFAAWSSGRAFINAYGEVDGVRIKVRVMPSGAIITGHPIDGHGVTQVKVKKDGTRTGPSPIPYGRSKEVTW